MSQSDCPSREDLVAYVVGRLPDDSADAVSLHVEACPHCRATLEGLDDAGDTLAARLRLANGEDKEHYGQESQCREALARLEDLSAVPPASEESVGRTTAELADLGRLGEYQLIAKLGQGGMGTVYKALHTKLRREVALKVLPKSRVDNETAIARFEREMAAVGAVDHPNIVRAMDAREVEGTRFLVMEFVRGKDLNELIRDCGRMKIADACEMVRQAALGLQCAHEHGLVHRDVKPSNLMLTHGGRVKLLDLGLARFQLESDFEGQETTATGQVLGTPDYMAPEQIDDSHLVDIRADIYALGCTLYKLLAGQAPFAGPEFKSTASKLIAHTMTDPPPIQRLRTDLPQPLIELIERMLAKKPAKRFATPAEVAAALRPLCAGSDLAGVLAEAEGTPPGAVKSSPGGTDEVASSALYDTDLEVEPPPVVVSSLARKTAPWKRHLSRKSVAVAVAAALAGVLLLGIILSRRSPYGTLTVETDDPNVRIAVTQGGRLIEIVDAGSNWSVALKEGEYDVRMTTGADKFQIDRDTVTVTRGGKVRLKVALKRFASHPQPRPEPRPKSGLTISVKTPATLRGHTNEVWSVAFSPDGKTLASAGVDRTIKLWDAAEGQERLEVKDPAGEVRCVAFSPDGRTLVTAGADRTVKLRDADSGRQRHVLEGHQGEVRGVAFSPDGKTLASTSYDKTVRFWNPAGGKSAGDAEPHAAAVLAVACSPDGQTWASAGDDGTIKLWYADDKRPQQMLTGHAAGVCSVAFSPDGRTLASAGWDKTIRLWDLATRRQRLVLDRHAGEVRSVAFSPGGKVLASASHDRTIKLWEVVSGALVTTLPGHTGAVTSVAFAPGGRMLASASGDKTVKLWPIEINEPPKAEPPAAERAAAKIRATHRKDIKGENNWVAFSPDGKTLSVSAGNTVKLWDVATGKQQTTLGGPTDSIWSIAFSLDGKRLASASWDKTVRVWDVATGKPQATLQGHTCKVWSVAFSPDGRMLASGAHAWPDSRYGEIKLWDLSTGKARTILNSEKDYIRSVRFSPDGKTLASGGHPHSVKLWDVQSGRALATLAGHTKDLQCLAFSPDGTTLASGGYDNTIKLWNLSSGRARVTLEGHTDSIRCLDFSPDGKTLASASWDKTVRLWDVAGGPQQATSVAHAGKVHGVAFSPDGKTLASACDDQLVRLWDIHRDCRPPKKPAKAAEVSAKVRDTRVVDKGRSESVATSPDGKTLATGNHGGKIRLLETRTGRVLHTLDEHKHRVSSLVFSPDGKRLASGSWDKTVKVWDVATGQARATLTGSKAWVRSVAFSPDGRTLASADAPDKDPKSGQINLWDLATGKARINLKAKTGCIPLRFSPDGKTLASGGELHSAILWDVESGRKLATLSGHAKDVQCLAFSPDGKTLASGSFDNTIKLWSLPSGRERVTLKEHTNCVRFLDFSPDGNTLASASCDNTVKLWDVAGCVHRLACLGHPSPVSYAAFSPDGKALTTYGFSNSMLKLWDIQHAARPAAKPCPKPGEYVDLLKPIDPKRDAFLGNWTKENGELVVAKQNAAGLKIPYEPPEEYVLEVEAVRTAGNELLGIGLAVGDRRCAVVVDKEGTSGLIHVDGQGILSTEKNDTKTKTFEFVNGKPTTIVCTVRKDRIRAEADGTAIVDFRGDFARLSLTGGWSELEQGSLGLATYKSAFRIKKLRLRPLSEADKPVVEKPSGPGKHGRPVDLLKLIDPKRDAIVGEWHFDQQGALINDWMCSPRLATRYEPPQEYVLKIEVERIEVDQKYRCFGLGLAAGGRQCKVVVDNAKGLIAVEKIDGQGLQDFEKNPTKTKGPKFVDGKPLEIVATVRDGHITVESGGRTFIDWKGDFSRLGTDGWSVGDTGTIWLSALSSKYRITRLELTPLSGEGRLLPLPEKVSLNADKVPCRAVLEGHTYDVREVAFSADGKTLISAGTDGKLLLWDPATGKQRKPLGNFPHPIRPLASAHDDNVVAAVQTHWRGSWIKLWNVDTGKNQKTLKKVDAEKKTTYDLAFSPDDKTLAAAHRDGTIRLLSASTGDILATLSGHSMPVHAVAFSSCGKVLASGSPDRTVRLWDPAAQKELFKFDGHQGEVSAVAYSPDGLLLASAGGDRTIIFWDPVAGKQLRRLEGHGGQINALAFSPDGKLLASTGWDKTIRLWDVAGGRPLAAFEAHGERVWSLAFSPDGRTLASASYDKTVKLWDVPADLAAAPPADDARTVDLLKLIDPERGAIEGEWRFDQQGALILDSLGFAKLATRYVPPDEYTLKVEAQRTEVGKFWKHFGLGLVAGGRQCKICVDIGDNNARLEKFAPLGVEPEENPTMTKSPPFVDGEPLEIVATVRNGHIKAESGGRTFIDWKGDFSRLGNEGWSVGDTGTIWLSATTSKYRITRLELTPLSGEGRLRPLPEKVSLNADRVPCRAVLRGHSEEVLDVSFSADGKTLVSAAAGKGRRPGDGRTGQVFFWDLARGNKRRQLGDFPHPIHPLAATHGSNVVAAVQTHWSGSWIKLWNVDTGEDPTTIDKVDATKKRTYDLAVSPDDKTLAAAHWDGTIQLLSASTGEILATLSGHSGRAYAVAFSPDGRTLASGSHDRTVRIWDPAAQQELFRLDGHRWEVSAVAYSPDGTLLASAGGDRTIIFWNPATGKQLRRLEGHGGQIDSLAFSPDGTLLASAGWDETIRFWDVASGRPAAAFTAHEGRVHSLAFSPDGRTLASAGHDKTVKLWDVRIGSPSKEGKE